MNFLGITFKAPHNSIYFGLWVLALVFLAYRLFRSHRLFVLLGKSVQGKVFLKHASFTRTSIKSLLWAAALFCIIATLMHPSWNKQEETVVQEGRDLFIAFDISASMLATDLSPNRLEFAKSKIRTLVNALPSERIGLILFSGSSFIQCPLTRDRNAFFMYLNQVDSSTIASGSTALDTAIEQALVAFNQIGSQKNKLLVIFTDGEDFSHNLSSLKHKAQEQNLTIFTIGIGTAIGSPIPLIDQYGKQAGHLKDKQGNIIITHLNDELLQNLAQDLGVIYLHASSDNTDVNQLVSLVMQREKEKREEKTFGQLQEQYPYFLLVSLVLLLIEWLL